MPHCEISFPVINFGNQKRCIDPLNTVQWQGVTSPSGLSPHENANTANSGNNYYFIWAVVNVQGKCSHSTQGQWSMSKASVHILHRDSGQCPRQMFAFYTGTVVNVQGKCSHSTHGQWSMPKASVHILHRDSGQCPRQVFTFYTWTVVNVQGKCSHSTHGQWSMSKANVRILHRDSGQCPRQVFTFYTWTVVNVQGKCLHSTVFSPSGMCAMFTIHTLFNLHFPEIAPMLS
jgi:hypothetical protein